MPQIHHLAATTIKLPNTMISFNEEHLESGRGLQEQQNWKGLHLWINQPMVNVTITNTTVKNFAEGNVEIHMFNFIKNPSRVYFVDCCILNGRSKQGGGVYVTLTKHTLSESESDCRKDHSTTVSFTNTTFQGNKASYSGGAFQLQSKPRGRFCFQNAIKFYKCTFTNNRAEIGGAMLITQHRTPAFLPQVNPQLSVWINSCTFNKNNFTCNDTKLKEGSTVFLSEVDQVVISSTKFDRNNGSALLLRDSTVLFKGNIKFSFN